MKCVQILQLKQLASKNRNFVKEITLFLESEMNHFNFIMRVVSREL